MEARDFETSSPELEMITTDPKFTDLGNAERLIEHHGHELRYVPQWGWLVWDGKRWARDEHGEVMELAKETVRDLRREAAETTDRTRSKEIWDHANRSEARYRLEAMVKLAQSDRSIQARAEDFDADPWLFNCQNGTLDLRTGELRLHDPADLITKLSPAPYEPGATSGVWQAFLHAITCGDAELEAYLQQAMGYSLTGSVAEKGFFLCFGPDGNNGKSTLLEAVLYMMGDYGAVIDPQTLMAGTGRDVRNAYTALVGARYVVGSEPEDGQTLAMGEVKRLTGSDTITAMYKYKEPFAFKPQLKLWLSTNTRPNVGDASNAAWDRIKIVPFNATFPRGTQDKALPAKLREAAPAILAWAVAGFKQWQDAGLCEPAVMRDALEDYRSEQDPFVRFLRERCEVAADAREAGKTLLDAYTAWAGDQDESIERLTAKKLYEIAANHGFKKGPISGKNACARATAESRQRSRAR